MLNYIFKYLTKIVIFLTTGKDDFISECVIMYQQDKNIFIFLFF